MDNITTTNANANDKSRSSAELRKIKKPIIEKKRRNRINESLGQLKSLILEALNKDESQYNKMEKADILELTVKHLRNVHNNQKTTLQGNQPHCCKGNNVPTQGEDMSPFNTPSVNLVSSEGKHFNFNINESKENRSLSKEKTVYKKYKEGYKECMQEVNNYLNSLTGVQPEIKQELTRHLATRVQNNASSTQPLQVSNGYVQILPQESLLASPNISDNQQRPLLNGIPCVQPMQLANGQTILVANSVPAIIQQQPMIQPTPQNELCHVMQPTLVQTEPHQLGTVMAQYIPQTKVVLPEQTYQPIQVVTYNVNDNVSSNALANPLPGMSPCSNQKQTSEGFKTVIASPKSAVSPQTASTKIATHAMPSFSENMPLHSTANRPTDISTTHERLIGPQHGHQSKTLLNISQQPGVKDTQQHKTSLINTREEIRTHEKQSQIHQRKYPEHTKQGTLQQTKRPSYEKQDSVHQMISPTHHKQNPTQQFKCPTYESQGPIQEYARDRLAMLQGSQSHTQSMNILQISPTSDRMWRPW